MRHSLAAMAMTAMVVLAVTGSQPFAIAPTGVKSVGTVPDTQPKPVKPSAPHDVYLQANFAIDPVPAGFELADVVVTRVTDQLMTLRNTEGQQVLVAVFQPGAFDIRGLENPKPVKIGDHSGFYDDQLFNVLTAESPDPDLRLPAAVIEYAPNSWYVVQTELQGQAARDAVLQIARNVRIGTVQPLRFPIQLRYLPAGLRPCFSDYRPATSPSWEAQIGLCDDQPGDIDPPYNGSALEITCIARRRFHRPLLGGR